jgi:phospholipid/cholesterol/gamma-HCH transport system permease protein
LAEPRLTANRQEKRLLVEADGTWTAPQASAAEALVDAMARETATATPTRASIDVAHVERLDTYGAWLLERLARTAGEKGVDAEIVGLDAHDRGLFEHIRRVNREPPEKPRLALWPIRILERLGRATVQFGGDFFSFLQMLGAVAVAVFNVLRRPSHFRFTSMVHHLDRVGWNAIPIVLLITFLIGCIIAQQGFFHFRKFGADSYVVDMVGILVLRELGVLIVAIMIAGRSGSSYTAELGSMKMREEIDALRTMSLDPVEVLILPRILAIVIALPVLAFLGSMAALFGGGLVAWLYADMSPAIYIARLREAISVTHFEVGMIKAPFMAFVIGIVACSEGLRVKGSAESLGLQTTISVVHSIFLVIVLDGLFAIFFASIGM